MDIMRILSLQVDSTFHILFIKGNYVRYVSIPPLLTSSLRSRSLLAFGRMEGRGLRRWAADPSPSELLLLPSPKPPAAAPPAAAAPLAAAPPAATAPLAADPPAAEGGGGMGTPAGAWGGCACRPPIRWKPRWMC